MTVKELIEELKDVPEDTPVCLDSPDDLCDGIEVFWKMERGRIAMVVLA